MNTVHTAWVSYRPVGDPRRSGLPKVSVKACATPAELDAAIDDTVTNYLGAEYEVMGINREEMCARCNGSARVHVRPKGKRGARLPLWACKSVPCPECQPGVNPGSPRATRKRVTP